MRIVKQPCKAFRTFVLIALSLPLSNAWATELDPVPQADTNLLYREKVLVENPPLSPKAFTLYQPVYGSLQYKTTAPFQANPGLESTADRPRYLDPLGEVLKMRRRPTPVATRQPEKKESEAQPPPVVVEKQPTQGNSEEVSNAFLAWVKSHAEAPQKAKEAFEKTQQPVPPSSLATATNDIFLNMRFPYTGAESPPSKGSQATYTTPSQ